MTSNGSILCQVQEHPEAGYDVQFLAHLNFKTTAAEVAKRGIKIIHNGGALNPEGLYKATKSLLEEKGLSHVIVAWVDSDDVEKELISLASSMKDSPKLDKSELILSSWTTKLYNANDYIGMRGIRAALNAGAQIIICGRICSGSAAMALGAWYAIELLSMRS